MFMFLQNISPGAVLTEMLTGFIKNEDHLKEMNPLQEKDLADAVVYALGTPERVEVSKNKCVTLHYEKQTFCDIFWKH